MRTIFGKQVLEDDAEVFRPSHTALVVVDVQNDFVHPEGHFAAHGHDVGGVLRIVPRVEALVEAARAAGVRVVWIQQTTLPDGESDSPAWLAYKLRLGVDGRGVDPVYTVPGTWGHELVEPLAPAPGEAVVRKFRSTAFVRTDLDALLRDAGVASVVVCGCVTEGCVEATVRDAAYRDYYVGVVSDAVGSIDERRREASLLAMSAQFRVRSSEEIVAAWSAGGGDARPAADARAGERVGEAR